MAAALKKDKVYLYTWPEKVLTFDEQKIFQAYVKRREEGEPLAYILGEKEFWSLSFKVNPSVLIPRPDTETLVCAVLDKFSKTSPLHVLELGTGSGAIACALAKECPSWTIIATDISFNALQVAKLNANILALSSIQWVCSNWFESLSFSKIKFDIIISNPPYIDKDDSHLINLSYEPKNALIAENAGYFALQTIISQSKNFLSETGCLFLEHGSTQKKEVVNLFRKHCFYHIKTIKDLAGVNRVTMACVKK